MPLASLAKVLPRAHLRHFFIKRLQNVLLSKRHQGGDFFYLKNSHIFEIFIDMRREAVYAVFTTGKRSFFVLLHHGPLRRAMMEICCMAAEQARFVSEAVHRPGRTLSPAVAPIVYSPF